MLDGLTILISLGLVVFIVIRAVRLDRERPWFDVPASSVSDAAPPAAPGPVVPPWRQRGGAVAGARAAPGRGSAR